MVIFIVYKCYKSAAICTVFRMNIFCFTVSGTELDLCGDTDTYKLVLSNRVTQKDYSKHIRVAQLTTLERVNEEKEG